MKNKILVLIILFLVVILFLVLYLVFFTWRTYFITGQVIDLGVREISAYNPQDPSQTDSTPCYTAAGYICDVPNAAACPREIPLWTRVLIGGEEYICLDRLAEKYNHRFDLALKEGAKEFGIKKLSVIIK